MKYSAKKGLWSLLPVLLAACLSACGFQLDGASPLATPLHSMYLQTTDPYGTLTNNLKQSLKMSGVQLASNPGQATTILSVTRDDTTQTLLSVSGTQQSRQYELKVLVSFIVTDNKGRMIIDPQNLSEARVITMQSNQILGSSNEASQYFKDMRRAIATAIVNRLSSRQLTRLIDHAFPTNQKQTTVKQRKKHSQQ